MFERKHMTVGDWLLYFILFAIPIVNIIVIILILLNPKANPSLRNFIVAQLVLILLFILFGFALFSTIIGYLANLAN